MTTPVSVQVRRAVFPRLDRHPLQGHDRVQMVLNARHRITCSVTSMAGEADLVDKDFRSYPRERLLTLFYLLNSCRHKARHDTLSLSGD